MLWIKFSDLLKFSFEISTACLTALSKFLSHFISRSWMWRSVIISDSSTNSSGLCWAIDVKRWTAAIMCCCDYGIWSIWLLKACSCAVLNVPMSRLSTAPAASRAAKTCCLLRLFSALCMRTFEARSWSKIWKRSLMRLQFRRNIRENGFAKSLHSFAIITSKNRWLLPFEGNLTGPNLPWRNTKPRISTTMLVCLHFFV